MDAAVYIRGRVAQTLVFLRIKIACGRKDDAALRCNPQAESAYLKILLIYEYL